MSNNANLQMLKKKLLRESPHLPSHHKTLGLAFVQFVQSDPDCFKDGATGRWVKDTKESIGNLIADYGFDWVVEWNRTFESMY